jgi:omega-hydroxy-beta-dihydromenaquinone-9 sulfotransferase
MPVNLRDDLNIIFAVGNSRSGTTMMGHILAGHPCVELFDEQHFFEEMWQPELNPMPLPLPEAERLLTRIIAVHRAGYYHQSKSEKYAAEARRILATINMPLTAPDVYAAFLLHECRHHDKTIACDHTPRNLYYLTEILDLYPNAHVVNVIRDPRAVLLSQKNRPWRGRLGAEMPRWDVLRLWANYHPITMGILWNSGIAAGHRTDSDPRVVTVRFEDLLADPKREMERICTVLGIDFFPHMLDVPQAGSSNVPARVGKVGIDPTIADQWQRGGLTPTEIYLIERITRRNLLNHGYALTGARPNLIVLAFLGLNWALKAGLSFLLNAPRVSSLTASFRRRFLSSQSRRQMK